MTRTQLIRAVAERADISQALAARVVHGLFEQMRDALCQERRVEIRGFGTFQVKRYEGYQGRNPKNGARIQVKPKALPVFRTGKDIHRRLNDSRLNASRLNASRLNASRLNASRLDASRLDASHLKPKQG